MNLCAKSNLTKPCAVGARAMQRVPLVAIQLWTEQIAEGDLRGMAATITAAPPRAKLRSPESLTRKKCSCARRFAQFLRAQIDAVRCTVLVDWI